MANGKNKVTKKQDRRAFLKQVGVVGAAAVLGATTGLQQTQAQQPRPGAKPKEADKAPPPEVEKARALIGQLQKDLNTNPALKARYKNNPREVMAERGFGPDLIREVLTAPGSPQYRQSGCLKWSCIITECGKTIVVQL